MKIKEGVVLFGLDPRMRWALIEAERLWKKYGIEEGVTVTSGLEGEHSAGSLHYYGLALDFRTRYFTPLEKDDLAMELINCLSGSYDVIVHKTHIHVEWRMIDGSFDVDGFFDE